MCAFSSFQPSFHFNSELVHKKSKDFKQMVGVETWMFFLIVVVILLDGFIHPDLPSVFKAVNSIVAIIATLTIGTKLNCVFTEMTEKIIDKLKEDTPEKDFLRNPTISARDLHILQDRTVSDPTLFDDAKPSFWCMSIKGCICIRPNLNIIRFTIFQNSLMFAPSLFFL